MTVKPNRREFLNVTAAGAAMLVRRPLWAATEVESPHGCVIGEPTAQRVGAQILADGGNAIDAIVAAALAAAVAAPNQTGIGGYGGTATLGLCGGKGIVSLDFNSAAPAAAYPRMFKPGANGAVPGGINQHGWLAAGVPGILAGLQLALDRFGTRSFREVVAPAIAIARDGYPLSSSLAGSIQRAAAQLEKDAGSRKLYFADGKPLPAGATFRNPELAEMLATLAQRNSVESFYRGDIAQRIAEAFQKGGGLVTAQDLAAYRARVVEPLVLACGDLTVHTAPLTAGGLTTLQAIAALQAMRWERWPATWRRTHARIEALRLAWRDRLTLLGDPDFVKLPVARLLSADYARESAERIEAAVKAGKYLPHAIAPQPQTGTINLSAVDEQGNLAALTLTHGEAFGARVTVEGLGLTLGHGMSRFDPHPDHPNAPGPGKRPLHNMVPTVVTRAGKPVLAAGGRGGRKIPDAMFEVLTQYCLLGAPLAGAISAPRMHTEGDASVTFEKGWPPAELASLRNVGYRVKEAASATISAVAIEQGAMHSAMR